MNKLANIAGAIFAVALLLSSSRAAAIEFEVNKLTAKDLSAGRADGVKYGKDVALSSQRHARLDYPKEREIRFFDPSKKITERTIKLLGALPEGTTCPQKRPIYMMEKEVSFTKSGLDISFRRLSTGTCSDHDSALIWYETAFDNLGIAVNQIKEASGATVDSLAIVSRYLVALRNACVVLSYESACDSAISYSRIYAAQLSANEAHLSLGSRFAEGLLFDVKESIYKSLFRAADQSRKAKQYSAAAPRFADVVFRCSSEWEFCEAKSLTRAFLHSYLNLTCEKISRAELNDSPDLRRVCAECLTALDQIKNGPISKPEAPQPISACKPI